MVIRLIEEDKIISKVFRSGKGGSINLIIPKLFLIEMGLEPSDDVTIFYNRQQKQLEIKKYDKARPTIVNQRIVMEQLEALKSSKKSKH
jgi:bifunctional DNA-binding transcriptional regulator/antitoxin component of YhaV-PrlF toxin-antitoxin module